MGSATGTVTAITGTTTGSFAYGPFLEYSEAGTYSVIFQSVTLNSVVVTSFTGSSSFQLIVSTLCPNTTLSWAIAPTALNYNVASSALTSTVSATNEVQTSDTTWTANICGSYTYTISDSPSSKVKALN